MEFVKVGILAGKIGRFILCQKATPAELYEASSEVYIAVCEAGISSGNSLEAQEEIRRIVLMDMDHAREYIANFNPPSQEEWKNQKNDNPLREYEKDLVRH